MKILPIKKLWHQLIENAGNGNAVNVKDFSNERNCTGIISSPSLILPPGSQIGIPTWRDYSLEKSSPYVLNAICENQEGKIVSDEQPEKNEKALKFDEGKPDLSQVSSELMEHLAR